ncbi:hypothetical protein GH714_004984 [Hevea brasiliensis]|uniref:BHLH domain-containing protein n=1 Tax=Hevea brasiliensis TaxID=3981 RepID=A0A6A6LYE9_HEVBR|nr:hypothetical protein GH714_004984 [Hevea brasiliensis]
MADSDENHLGEGGRSSTTSFSQLLFSDDDNNDIVVPSEPTMSSLQKSSGVTCSDSSSTSSAKNNSSSSNNINVNTASRSYVRKEKLGERVTALQQLVSPFGKTDTASVLHEAMGYIRFLQDQVQVLCSPYLQDIPAEGEEIGGEEPRKDLRSRGLCLVPVELTLHVASSNGADYWSPVMGNNQQQNSSASESICPRTHNFDSEDQKR